MEERNSYFPQKNERSERRSDETASIRRVALYAFVLNLGLAG